MPIPQISELPLSVSVTVSAPYTYIAEAAPGSALTDPVWRIMRLDANGGVTYPASDPEFVNQADDPTNLSYAL